MDDDKMDRNLDDVMDIIRSDPAYITHNLPTSVSYSIDLILQLGTSTHNYTVVLQKSNSSIKKLDREPKSDNTFTVEIHILFDFTSTFICAFSYRLPCLFIHFFFVRFRILLICVFIVN